MHRHTNAYVHGTGVAARAFAACPPAAVKASSPMCWLTQLHVDIETKNGPGTRRLGERSP